MPDLSNDEHSFEVGQEWELRGVPRLPDGAYLITHTFGSQALWDPVNVPWDGQRKIERLSVIDDA